MMITVLAMMMLSLFPDEPVRSSLQGQLIDEQELPITGTVTLKNQWYERTVGAIGAFTFSNVPPGSYELELVAAGFRPKRQSVEVTGEDQDLGKITLESATLKVSEVVVAPSTFSMLTRPMGSTTYLDRETLKNTPHFNEDPYRALENVPGTTSNDIGASFAVRGGQYREIQVSLDGMELVNPFHLKDFTGVFSIFDPEMMGGLSLQTGGYAARYGNAMSGILEMSSVEPQGKSSSVGISLGNLSLRTEGRFADGQGSYLFSARRGYLDILLGFTDDSEEDGQQEESDISYLDSFGKVRYVFNSTHALGIQYLYSGDDFMEKEQEEGEIEENDSTYDDLYLWVNWDANWTDRLTTRTTLYSAGLKQNRRALSDELYEDYDFFDNRDLDYAGIKQDWSWEISDNQFLRAGFDVRDVSATYDYRGLFSNAVPIGGPDSAAVDLQLEPEGEEYAVYVTDRFRLGRRWTFELGLRYDRQTLVRDDQISPRLNVAYEFDNGSVLRFAQGVYHQAERAYELQVADGVSRFSEAERSDHWLVGYEGSFGNNIKLRAEAYYKDLDNPRTRYENLTRSLVLYPGGSADRIAINPEKGSVGGVEVSLMQNLGGKLSWFFNYAWSRAEDEVDGIKIRRQWDQEHAVNAALNYRYGRRWSANLGWTWHTGWRTTPLSLQEVTDADGSVSWSIIPGATFSETFPAYHRLDLRLNYNAYKTAQRKFQLYVDIFNLYNRKNIRGYADQEPGLDDQGNRVILSERDDWLPILPSVGVNWKF